MSHRLRGLAAALVTVALAATASPAFAAKPPPRPGAVSNLQLVATMSNGAYEIASTWSPATNATRYDVRLSAGTATLEASSVTTTSWTAHTTQPEGTLVTLSVTPYNGTRKGTTSTRNLSLPDLTAPLADYDVTNDQTDSRIVTLSTLSRSSDVVSQVVDWGDGSPTTNWGTDTPTVTHTYVTDAETRYTLTIRVTDDASLSTDVEEFAVVLDEVAPAGAFGLTRSTAWASWTKVGLTTTTPASDEWTPADLLKGVITWGDGTTTAWAPGTTPTHVYTVAGSYSPTVVLSDEAGNDSAPIASSTVVVAADRTAPVVRLSVPMARKSVRAWKTLRGTAVDAGVGVRSVQLRAVEKRGTAWYAYRSTTKTWTKVGTKARALRKATVMSAKPGATNAWAVGLARLTKGTLVYQTRGVDNVGNISGWLVKKAVLTKR
jgi:hypothetical protein